MITNREQAHAKQWLDRLTPIPHRTQVVLGLGEGLHILPLAQQIEDLIYVVDPRQAQCLNFKKINRDNNLIVGTPDELFPEILKHRYQVQAYRPAWKELSGEFEMILDWLNLRLPESAAMVFELRDAGEDQLISFIHVERALSEARVNASTDSIRLIQEMIR